MLADQIQLHRVRRILSQVNQLKETMRQMSDSELKNQTKIFKQELHQGKSLDQILPRAFATIREADYRVLGMFPYDVQVMGGIVLHQGNIAEMKTGEGKTLTATMPLYLNALSGKGAMLVTPNDYLAARDEKQLQPVYNWLGLSAVAAFVPEDSPQHNKPIPPKKKRDWYQHDIVYTTASALAFDYLFDNLASSKEGQYLRPYNYVIIDEVDDVLLDEATSPFVVSSKPMLQSNLYQITDHFVRSLVKDVDFKVKRRDKAVYLTYGGVLRAQKYFRIDNLFDSANRELCRHILLALRAHFYMRNGREYLVENGEVQLLDEENGRVKEGVKISSGLHQAIEAKEGVKITKNQKVAASITFPSLFGLFNNVAGMSGTAKVDESEFMEVYKMRVVQIPTRKPVIRKDYPDEVYVSTREKLLKAINYALQLHRQGRPILMVAGSVENSEIISEILLNHGIAHNVLNAFNVAREAAIVKDAGQRGAVTVATNMAGRGTDIKLGPGVKELGGLAVIGTEMLPERVKLQLAGRAGRQGDPGSSRFFISLEDNYISSAATKRFRSYYRRLAARNQTDDPSANAQPINNPRLMMSLQMLKGRVADKERQERKDVNKNETALKFQRKYFYRERRFVMHSDHLEPKLYDWLDIAISHYIEQRRHWQKEDIQQLVSRHFSYEDVTIPAAALQSKKALADFLRSICQQTIGRQSKLLVNKKQLNQFYRSAMLTALDDTWMGQMQYLSNLRIIVQPFKLAGRDPGFEYQDRAFNEFKKMLLRAKLATLDNICLSHININRKGQLVVHYN